MEGKSQNHPKQVYTKSSALEVEKIGVLTLGLN